MGVSVCMCCECGSGLCTVCVHVCLGMLLVCALCGVHECICTHVYMWYVCVEYDVCGISVSVYVWYTCVCL